MLEIIGYVNMIINSVGIFLKKAWTTNWSIDGSSYDAGVVYIGIDTNNVGIIKTHSHLTGDIFDRCLVGTMIGNKRKGFTSNCVINDEISFETVRTIMKQNNIIDVYEIGKATPTELADVLVYSYNLFELNIKSKIK